MLKNDRPLADYDEDEDEVSAHEGEVMWNQFLFGDFMFSLARVVNFLATCSGIPAFIAIQWPTEVQEPMSSMEVFWHIFAPGGLLTSVSLFLITVIYTYRWWWWISQSSKAFYKHDCIGFLYCVLLLRKEDPRLVRTAEMNDDDFL